MISYVCKYTPTELFAGFGEQCVPLETMRRDYPLADKYGHQNICGFGKSVIEAVCRGEVSELVLTNCCDVMRRVYDIARNSGTCKFVYFLDLPHADNDCAQERFGKSLAQLKDAYAAYSGKPFDLDACLAAFRKPQVFSGRYIGIIGARVNPELEAYIATKVGEKVVNHTCIGTRNVPVPSGAGFWTAYASRLLEQVPCRRMGNLAGRSVLYTDPRLKGIVYHSIKFCDFAQSEFPEQKDNITVPYVQVQTDFTQQSEGQLSTRLEAFRETISVQEHTKPMSDQSKPFVAGIDSGSTSTDVVIMDRSKTIVASMIIPTGGGAQKSADECLKQALSQAHLSMDQIGGIVATGYGRDYLQHKEEAVTEISCHARGAWFLDSSVRTVIDIGGQDSKVIKIDGKGQVVNFAMNDKCAAGTGKFLEAMARTLDLSLSQLAVLGETCTEKLTISSMCTVFAESEVVSLVAQNKSVGDIVHALDRSVANKVAALVGRVGLEEKCMITGGVSLNKGVVKAINEKLGIKLVVLPEAQICGAIGAALFALD